jgi:hypothetical protein
MAAQPPQTVPCRFCVGTPAADVAFRNFKGVFIWYRTQTVRGPMCRDCGTSMFRFQTGICLRLGWWAIWSIVANPVYLLLNYLAYRQIQGLGPATRPAVSEPLRPELPLLRQRVGLVATAGYLVVVVLLVTVGLIQENTPFTPSQQALVGTCVAQQSDGSYAEALCRPGSYRVISLAHSTSTCSRDTIGITLAGTPVTQAVVLCVSSTG